ncbi:unknown protein [Nostoc sp. NIES-3756]|uniref:hypothetical protein n=1 Tax=Nostoc sp. NIES-3756 TaxID=1751286 RepID=UPI0007226C8F|nr:hypothetical protein [Nostoc sp. NIES-3756]BAT52587.1 unknown protein [Nostoc sp. NIES-3756]BAY39724.1 hypothetical protein NIES2111_41010 [Nostoc sp. NIES-2111]
MKARIIPILAMSLSIASLVSPVRAQTPLQPNPNTQEYQLTGDSLEGIGKRSAQDDFSQFFNSNTVSDDRKTNQTQNVLRFNQSILIQDEPVILQPAQQSENDNDALQLQLDLENRR